MVEKNKKTNNNDWTTVAIYRDDLAYLDSICARGEMFRDRLHEILDKHKKESKK
jgi:hypothetical protein